ncbi:src substrate cortactin-like isoform X1 [Phyllobates terribilis]|uniref:src substrate cortactin-like isoform X1 n=2 Tax=Phyllobates terribilis TaxID=111132 RepID=UPI003CCB580A
MYILQTAHSKMWKAAVGHNVAVTDVGGSDDWETDPDFVNDITEEEQRWGAKTIQGSGRPQHIDIKELRSNVSKEHEQLKKKEFQQGPKASYGYGGQFGTEKDRMDKSALGHEYKADVGKHSSQTDAAKGFGGKYGVQKERCDKSAVGFDYKAQIEKHSSQQDHSKGFGGRFGVQSDRVDKSAVGFEHKEQLQKHASQQDHSKGFGGRFGVQSDRVDKSAVGFEHKEQLQKHASQQDHSVGFGGKFGVQKDRQDKSAHTWSHKEKVELHESQTDHAKGFGGRYGVQTDRVDKSASGFGEIESPSSVYEKTQPLEAMTSGAQNLRSRFENMAKVAEEENRQKADEERARRQKKDQMEREAQTKKESRQSSDINQSQKQPVSVPVPVPRISVTPQTPEKKISVDSEYAEYEAPPDLDSEYEAPPDLDSEYEAPPDLDSEYEAPPVLDSEYAEYEAPPDLDSEYDAPPVLDSEYEPPPVLPPRFPAMMKTTVPTPDEISNQDETYEDISVRHHASDEEYEDIPDPPQRLEEEETEDYEVMDPPNAQTDSLYEELPKEEPSKPCGQLGASGITAVALYDYEGGGDDEISFQPQDLITNIEMIDEGWWSGSCRGQRGLFPANYVELMQ